MSAEPAPEPLVTIVITAAASSLIAASAREAPGAHVLAGDVCPLLRKALGYAAAHVDWGPGGRLDDLHDMADFQDLYKQLGGEEENGG